MDTCSEREQPKGSKEVLLKNKEQPGLQHNGNKTSSRLSTQHKTRTPQRRETCEHRSTPTECPACRAFRTCFFYNFFYSELFSKRKD